MGRAPGRSSGASFLSGSVVCRVYLEVFNLPLEILRRALALAGMSLGKLLGGRIRKVHRQHPKKFPRLHPVVDEHQTDDLILPAKFILDH
jgi:hypothetical protein